MPVLRIRRYRSEPQVVLCLCGCGGLAPTYPFGSKVKRALWGTAKQYISGHNRRGKGASFSSMYSVQESGCWLWLGAVSSNGYGVVNRDGDTILAHRYSYAMFNGSIPEGLLVRHSCDVKLCVNPAHLVLGTHTDNLMDAYDRGLRGPKFATNFNRA